MTKQIKPIRLTMISDCGDFYDAIRCGSDHSILIGENEFAATSVSRAGNNVKADFVQIIRPVEPAWVGVGLPPVGTVCEWKEKTGFRWVAATVLFITESSVVMQRSDGFEWQMLTKRTVFRPVRTLQQIAADKRLHEIRNALTTINSKVHFPNARVRGNILAAAVEAMIDAGYRKPEIVDE